MSLLHLTIVPKISEKTYAESLRSNTYVFQVPLSANKQQVSDAVAAQYNVTVEDARMVVVKGKRVRTIRSGKSVAGRRPNTKKAYVTLKQGDTLDVFDGVEGEDK